LLSQNGGRFAGGSARIPKVQQLLSEFFDGKENLGRRTALGVIDLTPTCSFCGVPYFVVPFPGQPRSNDSQGSRGASTPTRWWRMVPPSRPLP